MVKWISFAILLFLAGPASSQETSQRFVKPGLLRAQATLSSGAMFGPQVTTIYLHGNLEYYADELAAIRTDGYYYITTPGNSNMIKLNHSLFSGGSYHFKTKGNFDPYFGVQPGLAISQMFYNTCPDGVMCFAGGNTGKIAASPLLSGVAGFNYYAQRLFHLFIETRYLYGKHLSEYGPVSLNELRFSFGLGWNFNVKKAH